MKTNFKNKKALTKALTIDELAWSRALDKHSWTEQWYEDCYDRASDPIEDYFAEVNRLCEIFEVPIIEVLPRSKRIWARSLSLRFVLEEANEEGEGVGFPVTIMVTPPCHWIDYQNKEGDWCEKRVDRPDVVDPVVRSAIHWACAPRWNAGEEATRLYRMISDSDYPEPWRIAQAKEELELLKKEVES